LRRGLLGDSNTSGKHHRDRRDTYDSLHGVLLQTPAFQHDRIAVAEAGQPLAGEYTNPGAELGEWIGKKRQKKQTDDVTYFEPEVGVALMKRAADDYPRRYAFLATGMLAGLRWGESVALQADDIKWDEGVIKVQRTWSEKSKVINPVKDSDNRRVPLRQQARAADEGTAARVTGPSDAARC
jgi:integrase